MARPTIADLDRRTIWIKYRISPNEHACITERCKATGLTLSDYNRTLAMSGAIVQREPLADQGLVRQLAAIGNNLNQLARTANITGEIDDPTSARLNDALDQLEGLLEQVIG